MAIYVDLDGTLAKYDKWLSLTHIGPPVPLMLERVKAWLSAGETVVLFTARLSDGNLGPEELTAFFRAWRDWCEANGLPELRATAVKGFDASEFWDDRAVQVEPNTGRRIDGGV